MKTSEHIGAIAKALVKAQGEFGVIAKTSDNPFFKSKYADLADVMKPTTPILAANGLAITQGIGYDDASGYDTLTTTLVHESGEYISSTMRLHLTKLDAQGQGSATTYARRYSYMAILGLVSDTDDDGNASASQYAASAPRSVDQAQTAQRSYPKGELTPQIQAIIDAAKADPTSEFLQSLSDQWDARGSLSPKQIEAGYKQAQKVLKGASSQKGFEMAEAPERSWEPHDDERPFD